MAKGYSYADHSGLQNLVAALIQSAITDRDRRWIEAFGRDFIGVLAHRPEQAEHYYALALERIK